MSIWDAITKGLGFDKVVDVAQKALGIPDAAEKRKQQNMLNDQVKAYKEQTELSRQELNKVKDAQVAEKRKIQEKQIRSLRRSYRPSGIMDRAAANTAQNDMSPKLGG